VGPGMITAYMKEAMTVEKILKIVRVNRHALNRIHVSTAFNNLGKAAKRQEKTHTQTIIKYEPVDPKPYVLLNSKP
jgi:hypothetical protein